MYKRDLENLINAKKLPKSMFLYGACDFQITHFGSEIASSWSDDTQNILTFYFDAYDFRTTKNYLSQSSLFGDKNVAIIKTQKAIPKKELDILVEICQKTENSYLLLQCYKEEKSTTSMTKSFSKKTSGDFVRFFKPNMGEAMQMLTLKAREKNINIQGYALNQLYQAQNEDLALAVNELDKLAILEREVNKKDIDNLVYGLGEVGLDAIISDIFDKKDIKSQLKPLLESGNYSHIDIVSAVQKYLVQLYMFHLYVKTHGSIDMRAILGYNLPRDLANSRSNQCMRLNLKNFKELFTALALSEFKLKTHTYLDKDAHLFSTILKIQSLLK